MTHRVELPDYVYTGMPAGHDDYLSSITGGELPRVESSPAASRLCTFHGVADIKNGFLTQSTNGYAVPATCGDGMLKLAHQHERTRRDADLRDLQTRVEGMEQMLNKLAVAQIG